MLEALTTGIDKSRIEISSVLTIIYDLSQLHLYNLKSYPFVKQYLPTLLESFDNIDGGNILKLLAIGRNTKNKALLKVCYDVKKGIFNLVNQNVFSFQFVTKVLREIVEWNENSYLTLEQQKLLVTYF